MISGYTEIEKERDFYRSHRSSISARSMTIINLSDCDIIHEIDQDLDTVPADTVQRISSYLT